jgi:hypothetical protein
MTYWPISSPSVFAATKHTLSESAHVSHDGAQSQGQAPGDGATTDDGSQRVKTHSEEQAGDDQSSVQSEQEPDLEQDESLGQYAQRQQPLQQLSDSDVAGEIIAVKLTRSGHMFATITRTTLTVWQTKARPYAARVITMLMVLRSQQPSSLLCSVLRVL